MNKIITNYTLINQLRFTLLIMYKWAN